MSRPYLTTLHLSGSALIVNPEVASPTGHGWMATENWMVPELITQVPAPKEFIELTVCNAST